MSALSLEEAEQLSHSSVPSWMLALHLKVHEITAESATLVMPLSAELWPHGWPRHSWT